MVATKTLFRTADGFLCEEGDPRAAFLLCRAGTEVEPEIEAIIVQGKMAEPLPEPQVESEAKAMHEPPETKAVRRPKLIKKT